VPKDGDSAYVEDFRQVSEAVKRIQQHAAEIRKETSVLGTAHSYACGRKKVQDVVHSAREAMDEAKRRLQRFSSSGGGSISEQKTRGLMQQKLGENLMASTKSLEAAFHDFEKAAAERDRREAASSGVAGGARAAGSVELGAMDGPGDVEAARQRLQLEEIDLVSQAEAETHTAIVDEYVQEISTLQQDIQGLQRAMVDLAEHAQAQGEVLDNIESNTLRAVESSVGAREQLTQAAQTHRRGTKLIYWLLLLAVILATVVMMVAVHKGRQGS